MRPSRWLDTEFANQPEPIRRREFLLLHRVWGKLGPVSTLPLVAPSQTQGFRQNAMPAHVFVQISLSASCFACAGRAPKCNHEAQANHATEFIQRLPGKYHHAHVLERLVRSLMVFILFSFLCWNGRVKAKAGFFSLKAAVV